MQPSICTAFALVLSLTTATGHWKGPSHPSWDLRQFKSLVTFGDSYTDENRLGYFGANNGSAPPTGWVEPMSFNTAGGGITWARWVSIYTCTTLCNYAVSGAVCSNALTPRTWDAVHAPFPDIAGYELPAFTADAAYIVPAIPSAPAHRFLSIPPQSTVYATWIGTNDLGASAFLTDSQVAGKTIADYIDCVYAAFDGIYAAGGRYFVLMNAAPLQLAPLYATPQNGGLAKSKYWGDKPANITQVSYRMWETVVGVNAIFAARTPLELLVKRRYPGARFAVFDVNSLITDIWNHPDTYLNGTAPANATGFVQHCDLTGSDCTLDASPDSFLWFDELHPSQQADRVIAKAFVDVVEGQSKWATYWA
ncbi:GDSL lipase/acylhydrolase family protein [Mytilinidion resinicola]|uniref:GDSL lipase/acylhydrolase family protein n=1 Tax=Mytilinidion resinicola TaxID=574789 RepID=A0A6A6YAY9_9PEZI|nr:GDSL lipase/acylhydrolase family protein [Mytilinidion resinicola]KAF2805663.1 GDSL lipase/acylhydrolase family protein [Mytilinidion resinicola]